MKCKQVDFMEYEMLGKRNYFGDELWRVCVCVASIEHTPNEIKANKSKAVGKYMLAKLHSTTNTTQLWHVHSLVYDYGK